MANTRGYTEVPADVVPDVPYWVNQALADIATDVGGLDSELSGALQWKGTIPASADVGALAPGIYYTGGTTNVATLTGLARAWPSLFIVYPGTTQVRSQEQHVYGNQIEKFWRVSASSVTWGDWNGMNGVYRGELPAGTNVYDMRGRDWLGEWDISGAESSSTILGTPPPGMTAWLPGQIKVMGGGGGGANLSSIIYLPYAGVRPRMFVTSIKDYKATGFDAWHAWEDALEKGSGGGSGNTSAVNSYAAGVPNSMRINALKEEYPLASTGQKGVVCFRYDHGLTTIKNTLLAMHQARGVKLYIAMNSRNWEEAENSGATFTDAKAWIASGLAEFGNHTADHRDRNTADGIYDAIVNGRKELEAQLGRTIHGFTVPGLSEYNKFEGFGSGSLNSFSETLAGSLILANHAISSGVIGSAHRVLDGEVRQGGRHYTWEESTFAEIKAQIDTAVTTKTALTLMAHPRNLGLPNMYTATLAQQVIDYVADLIAAGDLADMSYYQSHHATL